jgi:adenylate kinase
MKIILLGPPGVGKGTIAKNLSKDYSVVQISTGDLFREAISNNTELGQMAKVFIEKGQLVPDDIVVRMVKERIEQQDCRNGYILDGFPRTIGQADSIEKNNINIDVVLTLSANDDTIVQRISNRRMCRNCGLIYNLLFLKTKEEGKCDKCLGDLYQREDDKEATVKERLTVYHNQTSPLIAHYMQKGKLIEVDAEINEPDTVYKRVVDAINTLNLN